MSGAEKIGRLLSSNVPKDFWLHVEARYLGALDAARQFGAKAAAGHRASVTGTLRHFQLNEAFAEAFADAGLEYVPVRGNRIVTGAAGVVTMARVHLNKGPWDNSKRSSGKRKLCERNVVVKQLVQPDFLVVEPEAVQHVTVFLVSVGDGSPEEPAEFFVAVPDEEMDLRNPLFLEPLGVFLHRYAVQDVPADVAHPRLKPGIKTATPPSASDNDS